MCKSEYNENLPGFSDSISELPASEFKYYLFLLSQALANTNSKLSFLILMEAKNYIKNLDAFLKGKKDSTFLNTSLKKLQSLAGLSSIRAKIKELFLNLIGGLLSFFTGVLGVLIGGLCGFIRGFWRQQARWEYFWTAVVVGACVGGAIGFRTPHRIFKKPFSRQVDLAIRGLEKICIYRAKATQMNNYETKARKKLLEVYFSSAKELDAYLTLPNLSFEIATFGAEFISPKLAGSIGHHFFIRIPMQEKFFGIELSFSPSDYFKKPVQAEKRCINGKTLLEMLAFTLYLQEVDKLSFKYIVKKLKFGEIDCMTYIDKILVATNQAPTSLKRYHDSDNKAGKIIRFFLENLAAFPRQD